MSMTYVVPIPAPGLEGLFREAEGALPSAGPLTGERELTLVAVPCTDEMDGLDFGTAGKGKG